MAVKVTREDGRPAAGFVVRLKLESGGEAESRELTTNDAGRATFEVAPGMLLKSLRIPATLTTAPTGKWLDKSCRDGTVVEVALQVTGGWPLTGRVIGPDGAPVPEAEVFGWCLDRSDGEPDRTVQADGNGEFRLEHLGPQFRVTARAPGLACSQGLRGKLSDAVTAEGLTVRLATEKRMHGVVLDPLRNPVEGAEVWVDSTSHSTSEANRTHVSGILTFSSGHGRTISDVHGNFEILGLSHDQYFLRVKRAPYLVDRNWRSTGEEHHDVVLDTGLSLRGRVLDASGRPAVGARVLFWPFFVDTQTVEREVECDEEGEFLLSCMSLRREDRDGGFFAANHEDPLYAIAVHHVGNALCVVQPVKPSRTGGEYVEVLLEPERILAGRVVDPKGMPIAGVNVWIEGDREMETGVLWARRNTWEFCNGIADVETDEQGVFRFDRLYDGKFTVHAVFPGDPNKSVSLETRSGDEQIELVLDLEVGTKVVLVGEVRDGVTGQPVTKFTLLPMIAGSGTSRTFEPDDGRFELSGLPPGLIQITFKAAGYAQRQIPIRDYAAGEHCLNVELVPPRVLELLIVDWLGEPYEHGHVQALDLAGQVLWIEGVNMNIDSVSIRKGKATLHGLPAEILSLRVMVDSPTGPRMHEVLVDLTEPIHEPYQVVIERCP